MPAVIRRRAAGAARKRRTRTVTADGAQRGGAAPAAAAEDREGTLFLERPARREPADRRPLAAALPLPRPAGHRRCNRRHAIIARCHGSQRLRRTRTAAAAGVASPPAGRLLPLSLRAGPSRRSRLQENLFTATATTTATATAAADAAAAAAMTLGARSAAFGGGVTAAGMAP